MSSKLLFTATYLVLNKVSTFYLNLNALKYLLNILVNKNKIRSFQTKLYERVIVEPRYISLLSML